MACLDRFRHVLKAYIELLKQPFQPAGGLCPPDPPILFEVLFFIFEKKGFWLIWILKFHNLDDKIA